MHCNIQYNFCMHMLFFFSVINQKIIIQKTKTKNGNFEKKNLVFSPQGWYIFAYMNAADSCESFI